MEIIYEFAKEQENKVKVSGEVRDFFFGLAGIDINKPLPNAIHIKTIEERAERKHLRFHKNTGFPVSIEAIYDNGEQVKDSSKALDNVEFDIDLEKALRNLTDIQHYCFTEVCLKSRTQREVAKELGKSKSAVAQAINGARVKLKKYY